MADVPREYDREYTDPLARNLRVRLGYGHDRGLLTRFVLQLEYLVDDGWHEVVRWGQYPLRTDVETALAELLDTDLLDSRPRYDAEAFDPVQIRRERVRYLAVALGEQ